MYTFIKDHKGNREKWKGEFLGPLLSNTTRFGRPSVKKKMQNKKRQLDAKLF